MTDNIKTGLKTSDYSYDLPPELIAQDPSAQRDMCRLMCIDRHTGALENRVFHDIIDLIKPGDTLVLNDTKVIPARLLGTKKDTGASVEILLLKRVSGDVWETLVRPGKKLRPGARVVFGDTGEQETAASAPKAAEAASCSAASAPKAAEATSHTAADAQAPPAQTAMMTSSDCDTQRPLLEAEILEVVEDGNRLVRFYYDGIFEEVLDRLGEMPLPPYITKKLDDPQKYQTVYARYDGSAAAPTAGLHFTKELLQKLRDKGVNLAWVTLHVGLGTFRPVKVDDVTQHHMHEEWYNVPPESADLINRTHAAGKRVICVGTTSCRTIESAASPDGIVHAGADNTSIFIYPGYEFKVMDALITNFHLPESTLLMLVSAFAGRENMLHAYEAAVQEKYRFFSFGDACFIH